MKSERVPATARAGDVDRDAVIEELAAALAEGRLDPVEYDRRLDLAATAVTVGELRPLTADLPLSAAAREKAEAERQARKAQADRREWKNEWSYWFGGALVMTVIWVVQSVQSGGIQFYWPMLPLGIWGAILVAYAIWPEDKD